MVFLFLSSGLFLGWTLGANNASNLFGTAVRTRMLRFRTAALVCGVFAVLGATASGAGATQTLTKLGAINTLAGAFMVALAAAVAVYLVLRRVALPVSTPQAIVGAIVGWNLFAGRATDMTTVERIVLSWVFSIVLAIAFAAVLYLVLAAFVRRSRVHLLRQDALTRAALVAVAAFAAYSLGANNIANVMGVFVSALPVAGVRLPLLGPISGAEQLFFIGGLAIAVGMYTYSRRIIERVTAAVSELSPLAALVVVLAESLVLFLFSSQSLEALLARYHLPRLPLVPVSATQAFIGAMMGIGLVKGSQNVRFRVLGEIIFAWVVTPVTACLVSFIGLFFVQNVFSLTVVAP
jgi:PiT family inorganic phosphate transporter